ncbi:MAG: D-glycero-beta-D-manno-heptose 1,7-bisphosphate 7-phosphatase [Syntrophomonadaceae bacterium]|nr:D-glycero-beta-D-manno-heptose 1,7-bisphosphate 7-phosphatase [Syntrophomonadaceae bacterium]
MNKAVFLDRDGTINVEKNYLYKPEDWEWIQGSLAAIKGFNRLGYLVIVVTNQAGVARGLYNCDDVDRLHNYVSRLLEAAGAQINGYYYCPHHPCYGEVKNCDCRKPKSGLLFKAQAEHIINLKKSFVIGDKASDVYAGYGAGVNTILVTTGHGLGEIGKIKKETLIAENLFEAYKLIESRSR